jgi:hypothetical protein
MWKKNKQCGLEIAHARFSQPPRTSDPVFSAEDESDARSQCKKSWLNHLLRAIFLGSSQWIPASPLVPRTSWWVIVIR